MFVFHKMYKTINNFFHQEITCIPTLIEKYISPHYNNMLSNGIFWLIIFWATFHWSFDYFFNALFKRLKIREYSRQRLIQSLWLSGFYAGSLFYTAATLVRNNVDPFNNLRIYTLLKYEEQLRGNFILGFIVLASFFGHTVFWEALQKGWFNVKVVDSLLILLLMISTWFLSSLEFMLSFIFSVSISRLTLETSRLCSALIKVQVKFSYIAWIQFSVALILILLFYVTILPQYFLGPAVHSLLVNELNLWILMMNGSLISWFIIDTLNSPLFRLMKHKLCHIPELKDNKCSASLLDCVLFDPRNDLAFIMSNVQSEIEKREKIRLATINSKKQQYNNKTLRQTVQFIVTLKRKIRRRRETSIPNSSTSESLSTTDSE